MKSWMAAAEARSDRCPVNGADVSPGGGAAADGPRPEPQLSAPGIATRAYRVVQTALKRANSADPLELAALYAALRLEMVYNAAAKIVGVSIRPTGRGSNRVRGGT